MFSGVVLDWNGAGGRGWRGREDVEGESVYGRQWSVDNETGPVECPLAGTGLATAAHWLGGSISSLVLIVHT